MQFISETIYEGQPYGHEKQQQNHNKQRENCEPVLQPYRYILLSCILKGLYEGLHLLANYVSLHLEKFYQILRIDYHFNCS